MRKRLIDAVLADEAPPLVVLHAPAGYGKTLLMAQAHDECRTRATAAAWITLDASDADETTFVTTLNAALLQATQDGSTGHDLADLLTTIEAVTESVHVFIDDYQRCRTPGIDRILAQVIAHASAELRFVLATRERPQVGFAALIVGELAEIISTRALSFDDEDIAALRAIKPLPATVEAFLRKAEGWPAMLAIARAGADQASGQLEVQANNPALSEYLDQEVLGSLSEQSKAMLLTCSIPSNLTRDLLTHLTDPEDGWPLIEALAAQHLVMRADGDVECYRLNPILKDHLRARLTAVDRSRGRMLHGRAAGFYLEHGDDLAAARHAAESGDLAVIQRLLEHTSVLRLAFRGASSVREMLKAVGPDTPRISPHLAFAEIYLLALANRPRRAVEKFKKAKLDIKELGSGLPNGECNPFMEADALVIEALMDAYTDRFSLEKVAKIEQRLVGMDGADEILLAVIRELKLWGEYWNGNFLSSDDLTHFLCPESPKGNTTYVEIYGHFALGMSALERGDLDESERHHRMASDLAVGLSGPRASQARTARLLLSEVAYERNELERSRNLMHGLLDDVEMEDSWFDIFSSAYMTASLLAFTDSFEAALVVLDRAEATAARVGLQRLDGIVTAQRLKLAVMANELEFAREQYEALSRRFDFDARDTSMNGSGWRIAVPALTAAARFHLATDEPQRALACIAQMPIKREGHRQNRRILEAQLLSGIAHFRLSRWEAASSSIGKALQIAARSGMERAFIDLGEWLADPLDWMLRRPSAAASEIQLAGRLRPMLGGPTTALETASSPPVQSGKGMLLSSREYEVLVLMATGKTYKEVASDLGLSANTVMTHRKKLYEKLSSNSRSRTLSRARGLGLIP